jgi:cation diffusion facilitator family transporter
MRVPLASIAVLAAVKLAVWLVTGSVSVLSDAVHSLADLVVSIVQIVSVRLAARPADENHAYGHGKFENLSAALVAIFIAVTGALVVVQAIERLVYPTSRIAHVDWGIGVMFVSAVVAFVMSVRLDAVGRQEQSPALQAQATEFRVDVWTAAAVAIALVVIRFTGLTIIDPIMSLVVAGLIAKSAFDVSSRAFMDLTDGRLPPEQEELIREIIDEHRTIFVGYHKLRTRRSGAGEFIDFHLQMRGDMPLREAHDLSDRLVVAIKQELPRAHVLIHLEPEEG